MNISDKKPLFPPAMIQNIGQKVVHVSVKRKNPISQILISQSVEHPLEMSFRFLYSGNSKKICKNLKKNLWLNPRTD